jgi:hypothetical protein
VPRDLRTALVENEPPSITEHGSDTDVDTDHHITEEKPWSDESFSTVTRRSPHDHVIGRVKAESRRGKTTVRRSWVSFLVLVQARSQAILTL